MDLTLFRDKKFSDLKQWIEIRWSIYSPLILETDMSKPSDQLDEYENGYRKFISSVKDGTLVSPYSEQTKRYINSLIFDLDNTLRDPQTPPTKLYYFHLEYDCSGADGNAIVKKIIDIRARFNKMQYYDHISPMFEDFIIECISGYKRMAPYVRYSRNLEFGNQNAGVLYLLEIHAKNCSIAKVEFNTHNAQLFLQLHGVPGNLLALVQSTLQNAGLLLDGNNTIDKLRSVNLIGSIGFQSPKDIPSASQAMSNIHFNQPLPEAMFQYFPYVFDIEKLQFHPSFINENLPGILDEYNLFKSTSISDAVRYLRKQGPTPSVKDIKQKLIEQRIWWWNYKGDSLQPIIMQTKIAQLIISCL